MTTDIEVSITNLSDGGVDAFPLLELKPYQQRVVDERDDLDEKREKLRRFITAPAFEALVPAEQVRMRRQLVAMTLYSDVLGERIAAFGSAA